MSPSGRSMDVVDERECEDEGDEGSRARREAVPCAPQIERRSEGRGEDQNEDAGSISATLLFDVSLKYESHDHADEKEHQNERTRHVDPDGRHAKSREITRNQVEQSGHRTGAGEAEDQDGGDIIDRAEYGAEVMMREKGDGSTGGRPAGPIVHRVDQQRGDETRQGQHHAHDDGGRGQQPARVSRCVPPEAPPWHASCPARRRR